MYWARVSFASFVVFGLAGGCSAVAVPDLLTVHRLDPARASAGERITISGEGFPEGRRSHVTFRGDVFRPGAAPERDVRIAVDAAPLTRNEIVLPFEASLERRFSGPGASALHATFRGDVRVAFDAGVPGRTDVAGTARGVVFDVLPSVDGPPSEERNAEGAHVLAALGVTVTADSEARGLTISAVDPDGRAVRSGLRAGDVLSEWAGVDVLSVADLRVQPGQRVLDAVVTRDGRPLPSVSLDVAGIAPLGAEDLKGVATVLLVLCALIALPATRAGWVAKWFVRFLEARRRPRVGLSHAPVSGLLESTAPEGSERGPLAIGLGLALVSIFAAFTWCGLGRSVVSSDLDLGVSLLGASLCLSIARFIDGGARERGPFSLRGGLRAASATFACILPALIAVAGAVLASGRFVISEMVADQGGVPWRWAAARNPGLLLLFVALVASTVPEASGGGALPSAEGSYERRGRMRWVRLFARLSEWTHLWLVCGIGVALFLGGFRVPGVSSMAQEQSRPLQWVGVALFFVKLAATVVAIGAVRRLAARVWVEHVGSAALRFAVPAALAGFFVAAGFAAMLEGACSGTMGDVAAYSAISFVLACAGAMAAVALRARRETAGSSTVNPWL